MIILELLYDGIRYGFYYAAKFLVWIITARDCKHCEHLCYTPFGNEACTKYGGSMCILSPCYHSIVKKDFKRTKW